MTFRDREKERYKAVKPKLFSAAAQQPGTYRGKSRDFCLADDCASENLYEGIRESAVAYFADRGIRWHDGLEKGRLPSNHLCCSQSCCVNFLYEFSSDPGLLKAVFARFYPDLMEEPLRFDDDPPLEDGSRPFMAFEWIGTRDYLGEHLRKRGARTRGANYTSADFAFRFRRQDGKTQLVLGEWKYTEEYGSKDLGTSSDDKDGKPEVRRQNYCPAFHRPKGVFARYDEDLYGALFFEPFYQLMRLQLLAQEMEAGDKGREMDSDVVTILHICPEVNGDFRNKVTSRYLEKEYPGKGPLQIWQQIVPADRFLSISVEDLLDTIVETAGPVKRGWAEYLRARYGWERHL